MKKQNRKEKSALPKGADSTHLVCILPAEKRRPVSLKFLRCIKALSPRKRSWSMHEKPIGRRLAA